MVEKKDFLKKKLEEKQMKILLHIIEEEVESTYKQILLEYEYSDYLDPNPMADASDTTKGGLKRFFYDRSKLPGLLLSPAFDIYAALKKFGAKTGIALAGLVGMTIGGFIAGILPFNDPRTVTWIGEKFLAWETESMKWIDEQFKTETEKMGDGWETFKHDFWGIGFIAAPFNAIAAALVVEKGIDAALSVGNVITGGKIGALLQKINLDVKDPGDLDSYLKHGAQKEEQERKQELEKQMYTDRCLANLDDPNWLDPECLGFAYRGMFPNGPEGQQDFVDFVAGNAYKLRQIREKEFQIQFPNRKMGRNNLYKNLEKNALIRALKAQKIISENYEHKHEITDEIIEEASRLAGYISQKNYERKNLFTLINNSLKGEASNVNAAEEIKKMEEKFGRDKTLKVLKEIGKIIIANPIAKQKEKEFVNANLPKVTSELFGKLNQSILTGEAPNITLPQVQEYNKNAGNIAAEAIKELSKAKNIKIPESSITLASQTVEAKVQKDMAPLNKMIQDYQQPTVTPAAPARPVANPNIRRQNGKKKRRI